MHSCPWLLKTRLALVAAVVLCSCAEEPAGDAASQTDDQHAQWNGEALQKAQDYWRSLPSGGVVILEDGHVVAEWGEVGSPVKLSSVRKSLLSALYGPYVHEGLIDLDSTLDELGIDEASDPLTPTEKTATVRMLLQARSGIYHDYIGGRPGMLRARPARHSHPPGTFWYYNNWDFNTLGTIFEQEVDQGIGAAFEARIARPIGMRDFRAEDVYYLEGEQSSHRQYHFRMTARDLARFGQLMLQKGRWEGTPIVPSDWVEESTRSYSAARGGQSYGYMWWVAREGKLFPGVVLPDGSFAARGAVGKYLIVIPARKLVVAHIQLREWPDDASELPESQLPGPDDTVGGSEMGELLRLILAAQPGSG